MTKNLRHLGGICMPALALVLAPEAHADIGVPMVAVFLPPMWLSLIPVVFLEAWILRRMLAVPNRRLPLPPLAMSSQRLSAYRCSGP